MGSKIRVLTHQTLRWILAQQWLQNQTVHFILRNRLKLRKARSKYFFSKTFSRSFKRSKLVSIVVYSLSDSLRSILEALLLSESSEFFFFDIFCLPLSRFYFFPSRVSFISCLSPRSIPAFSAASLVLVSRFSFKTLDENRKFLSKRCSLKNVEIVGSESLFRELELVDRMCQYFLTPQQKEYLQTLNPVDFTHIFDYRFSVPYHDEASLASEMCPVVERDSFSCRYLRAVEGFARSVLEITRDLLVISTCIYTIARIRFFKSFAGEKLRVPLHLENQLRLQVDKSKSSKDSATESILRMKCIHLLAAIERFADNNSEQSLETLASAVDSSSSKPDAVPGRASKPDLQIHILESTADIKFHLFAFAQSFKLYSDTLELAETAFPRTTALSYQKVVVRINTKIARNFQHCLQFEPAIAFLAKAITVCENSSHSWLKSKLPALYFCYAHLLNSSADLEQSWLHYNVSLGLALPSDKHLAILSMYELAMILTRIQCDSRARRYFEDALKLSLNHFGTVHVVTGLIYEGLAHQLRKHNDMTNTTILLEKAMSIFEECFGPDHDFTQRVAITLGDIRRKRQKRSLFSK